MRVHGIATGLLLGALLVSTTACVNVGGHTETTGTFPGIREFHANKELQVAVLFVHGMGGYSNPEGTKGPEDPLPAVSYFARELGLRCRKGDDLELKDRWRGGVRVFELLDRQGAVALRAYSLDWKDTTRTYTTALKDADRIPPLPRIRPKTTQAAKDWMNSTVGDVVLYAGDYQGEIQKTCRQALTAVHANEKAHAEGTPTVIPITFSLGSRVMFDTLAGMQDDRDPAHREIASSVPVVYMLANQLQFLELANLSEPPSAATRYAHEQDKPNKHLVLEQRLRPLFNAIANPGGPRAVPGPVYFVGVTDPSDLLSWPLPENVSGVSNAIFVNAYHSVAETGLYIPTQGALGNPYKAHTGYGANRQVLRWLLYGHAASP